MSSHLDNAKQNVVSIPLEVSGSAGACAQAPNYSCEVSVIPCEDVSAFVDMITDSNKPTEQPAVKLMKPDGILDEYLQFGVYFKSEHNVSEQYLISVRKGRVSDSAYVDVYTIPRLDNYFTGACVENGYSIALPLHDIEKVVTLELFGKYFFPTFENNMQLYYDDSKYGNRKCKSNSILSLMEAIDFAVDYGLRESGITPY